MLSSAVSLADDYNKGIRRASGTVTAASEVGVGDLYALVVGVAKYKHPKIKQLTVSDKDAADFADFLKGQNKLFRKVHVTLLRNEEATKAEVEKNLYYKLRQAGKDDTVVLFFSGHGADDPYTPGEFYFLTHDAEPEYLKATAVDMGRQTFLGKLDSNRVLLIADACHAGGFSVQGAKSGPPSYQNVLGQFRESEGKVFLTSSRRDELSIEKPGMPNSVFTHYLLQGLKGEADKDNDGVVAFKELYDYVYHRTKDETKGFQRPQMEGRLVGPFPLSLCLSGAARLPDYSFRTKTDRLRKEGSELLRTGQFKQAEFKFVEMQRNCGSDQFCLAVAADHLATCCLGTSQYDAAIRYVDEGLWKLKGMNQPLMLGTLHHLRARVFQGKEFSDLALDNFQQAEKILRASGEQGRNELALVLADRAEMQARLYRYDKAQADLAEAGRLCSNDQEPCLTRVKMVGALIYARSQDARTDTEFEEVLRFYENQGEKSNEAQVLVEMGCLNESRSELEKGEKKLGKALLIARDIGDISLQASALNTRGLVSMKRGAYENSLRDLAEAYRLRRNLGQDRAALLTMANIGQNFLFSSANTCDEAEKALGRVHKEASEKGYQEAQAYSAHNLALLYKDQGKFIESIAKSEEAVELAEKTRDRKLQAAALVRWGNLLEYYGFFEAARDKYSEAEKIQKEIGDRFSLATTLQYMANITARGLQTEKGRQGQVRVEEARKRYQQALLLRKEIQAPVGEIACSYALFLLEKERYLGGEVKAGTLDETRRLLDDPRLSLEGQKHKTTAMLLSYARGRLLYHKKDYAKAIQEFRNLQQSRDAQGSPKYLFLANVGLGCAYEAQQDWAAAEHSHGDAVRYAEQIRETLDRQERRYFLQGEQVFGVKHIDPYEGLARVRFRRGDLEGSWKAAQQTRARGLADKLEDSLLKDLKTKSPELPTILENSGKEIRQVNEQLKKLQASDGSGREDRELKSKLFVLEKSLNKAREELKTKYPFIYEILYAKPDDLSRSALREDEWVLMYEVTDSGVLVYLTKGKKIQRAEFIPIPRRKLKERVDEFIKPMLDFDTPQDHRNKLNALKEFSLEKSRALYEDLVAPVIASVPESAPLIVCPDEFLALLPFEALVIGREGAMEVDAVGFPRLSDVQLLCDRHVMSYYQSPQLLTLIRTRSKAKQAPGRDFLVIADPKIAGRCLFGGERQRPRPPEVTPARREQIDALVDTMGYPGDVTTAKGKSPELSEKQACLAACFLEMPETGKLADHLKREFGAECLTGGSATLAMLEALRPRFHHYGTIVFATHGVAEMPLAGLHEPALLLSNSKPCEESWLRMEKVYQMDMNANLVWLTASETGVGRVIPGEGVMHMGSAFQIAGARSVTTALWSLPRATSSELTRLFFEEIKSGKAKAEALQAAKNKLRQQSEGKFSHPYWWAGIVLLGEPRFAD